MSLLMDLVQALKSHADPRTKDFPLIGDPTIVLTLICGYLYVIKVWGPKWMKNRQPFELKKMIMGYNLLMVCLNVFFFYKFVTHSYLGGGYSWICQGINLTDPESLPLVTYCWYYFLVRIVDFADTVFFLLRKKFTHISFLHVVHHTLVVWNGWLYITFGPDGQGILGVCINSFIHIIMYAYYFLSAFGPSVQKYLWWKKYITTLQILQFVVFILFISITLFKDCGYPKFLSYLAMGQCGFFLVLFVNFYIHAYILPKRKSRPLTYNKPLADVNGNNESDGHVKNGSAKKNGVRKEVLVNASTKKVE